MCGGVRVVGVVVCVDVAARVYGVVYVGCLYSCIVIFVDVDCVFFVIVVVLTGVVVGIYAYCC